LIWYIEVKMENIKKIVEQNNLTIQQLEKDKLNTYKNKGSVEVLIAIQEKIATLMNENNLLQDLINVYT
jgi:arsenate reductase-like glutaredoxin family protein